MSEEYTENPKNKGQRGTRSVKVYEIKQTDKDLRTTEQVTESRSQRTEESSGRQQTKYCEDYYWKENGLSKNANRNKNDYPSRKRRQHYKKFSKKEVLESHVGSSQPKKEFMELINENPQIFVKEKLTPLNIGFKKSDLSNDECINSTQSSTPSKNKDSDQRIFQKASKDMKTAALWDVGDGTEIFDEIDMKKIDAELRGVKNAGSDTNQATKSKDTPKESAAETNVVDEDKGEFSNIDVEFEQKLKLKPATHEDDEDEVLMKGSTEDEETDAKPIWEAFGADDIKKNVGNMENLFVQSTDNKAISNFGIKLEGNFDPFLDTSKSKEETRKPSGLKYKQIFPLYSFEDSLDEGSTDVSQNLTPVNELNWPLTKNTELTNQPLPRQPQQQQQSMLSSQPQQRQARPTPLNLTSCLSNKAVPGKVSPVQVGGEKAVQYVPLPNFPGFKQLVTSPDPSTIGLSKQIPPTKDFLFRFFANGSEYERKNWYYKDMQSIVRGPFSAREMDEWHNAKYLPLDLMITYGANNNFKPLSELIKYKESFNAPNTQQKPVQNTSVKQGVNLMNLSSNELQELMKNPKFIEYARASSLNVNQLMYLIKQREANEKANVTRGYNANSFESLGYYPNNSQDASRRANPTSNSFQSGISAAPDYYSRQGMYNNYNNIDYNQTNKRTSTQGYPVELLQQYSPGYSNAAVSQGSAQKAQPSFNFGSQLGSPSFMATDTNYKSMIKTQGGNNGATRFA